MLILSRVCVDFHDAHGHIVFSVTPATRNTFQHAPDAIQEDPLFGLLCKDGSLEAQITQARQKQMENDPTAGHDATGKLIPPEMSSEVVETDNASGTGAAAAFVAGAAGSAAAGSTEIKSGSGTASAGASGSGATSTGKTTRNKKAEPAG